MSNSKQQDEKMIDKAAPMPSAPFKYNEDGTVNWGDMWDSFCLLASEGGPPHRATMLGAQKTVNSQHENYQFAVTEIIRGIKATTFLQAEEIKPGWIAVTCPSMAMAKWVTEAILEENVEAKQDKTRVLVPVAEYYTVKGEIKNVITAVAKTTHYWGEHIPAEVKQTVAVQAQMDEVKNKVKGFMNRLTGKK